MKSIKAPLLAATSSVMLAMAMTASADAIPFRDDVGDEGAQQFAQGWDGVGFGHVPWGRHRHAGARKLRSES